MTLNNLNLGLVFYKILPLFQKREYISFGITKILFYEIAWESFLHVNKVYTCSMYIYIKSVLYKDMCWQIFEMWSKNPNEPGVLTPYNSSNSEAEARSQIQSQSGLHCNTLSKQHRQGCHDRTHISKGMF